MLKTKTKLRKIVLVNVIFTLTVFILAQNKIIFAENSQPSVTDLSKEAQKEIDKKNNQIEELEKKAETYQKIIDLKQKQQSTYAGQIELIENEVKKLEAEVEINRSKIESLNGQIGNLEGQITEKEKMTEKQKIILSELMRSYYAYRRQDAVFAVFIEGADYSNNILKRDRVMQTGTKINEVLADINAIKEKLQKERDEVLNKKSKVVELNMDLDERNNELESTKGQKELLVTKTKGEESKYQDLLANVEAQKQELLGDIDDLYNANSSELDSLASKLEKPTVGLASTAWFYSQKDKRWGSSRIGQSKSLVKDYGCALSSISMIFTYYGEKINPGAMAKKSIYSWDLINWPAEWFGGIKLTVNTKHSGVNWSTVDKYLVKEIPVIIFIKAKGKAGHYVIIHHKDKKGRYVVHDPYFGANIFLDSTMKLLGKLYGTTVSKNSIDQMVVYEK